MFAIHSGNMREARYLGDLFSLVVLILGNKLVANADTTSTSSLTPWNPPPLPPHLAQTRRTFASGIPISYRLDTWSQYENPEEGKKQEGDIHGSSQSRKTMTKNKKLFWPDGIVKYYIDSAIVNEPTKLAILEDAMDIITSKTCIKFERIYPDENGHLPSKSWVNITGNQNGCFSDLGRNPYGSSILNLNLSKCFRMIGHAIHEILHTLGVYHEHMRPDRDKYITIIWDNIRPGDMFNFRIMNESVVTDYGLPYDYDSIMHYSMTSFSKDRTIPTLIPTDRHAEIGQRNHLSYYDIQKLLITYNCTDVKKSDVKKDKKEIPKKYISKYKFPKENIPLKQKKKTEAMIIIRNPILNSLYSIVKDINRINLQKLKSKSDQLKLSKPYYCSLIYSPIYPHIHIHVHDN